MTKKIGMSNGQGIAEWPRRYGYTGVRDDKRSQRNNCRRCQRNAKYNYEGQQAYPVPGSVVVHNFSLQDRSGNGQLLKAITEFFAAALFYATIPPE